MTRSRYLFGIVRKKFFRSPPHETIIVFHTNNTSSSFTTTDDAARNSEAIKPEDQKKLSKEQVAAIRIQAFFRGHLARRAFRALKSLVKLQAVVRGVCVRRQARIALHCMHALARLQITVRARQLVIG